MARFLQRTIPIANVPQIRNVKKWEVVDTKGGELKNGISKFWVKKFLAKIENMEDINEARSLTEELR